MTAFEPGLAGGEGRGNPCEGTELQVERMVNTNPWGTSARVWRTGTIEARVGETGGEMLREWEHGLTRLCRDVGFHMKGGSFWFAFLRIPLATRLRRE